MNTTEVENFPGFPDGVMGPDLMDDMRAQAERFGAELVTDDVVEVELAGDGQGRRRRQPARRTAAHAVILATGSGYRELGLPDEKRLSGHGVSWCATCDGFFFREQDIVVVGGGDTAMEEATFLTRFAKSVTMVHRRDQLRAQQDHAGPRLGQPEDRASPGTARSPRSSARTKVTGVRLRDTMTGEERTLDGRRAVHRDRPRPAQRAVRGQLDLDDEGYILVERPSTRTNLPGVFAGGDVVDHEYRQADHRGGHRLCRRAGRRAVPAPWPTASSRSPAVVPDNGKGNEPPMGVTKQP